MGQDAAMKKHLTRYTATRMNFTNVNAGQRKPDTREYIPDDSIVIKFKNKQNMLGSGG